MSRLNWRTAYIFASDRRIDGIFQIRERLTGIIAEPYSLYAHIGSDGRTNEDAFTLLIYSEAKPDAERTAQAIRSEFKQEAVLYEVTKGSAYLATK
jgi:hypothetical protein